MSKAAFQALNDLASKCRNAARGLPAQQDAAPRWSGIGFSILGHKLVTPMNHVSEMMDVPVSTRLPGVQPWVMGLSNVRGRLLPLFDLAHFLGGVSTGNKKNHRVLVLETDELYSGIVVDMAFGMQHFTSDSFEECDSPLPDSLMDFIEGAYRDVDGNSWPVFSMAKLAADPRFGNAARI